MHFTSVCQSIVLVLSSTFIVQASNSTRMHIFFTKEGAGVIFICHLEKAEFKILNQFKEGLNLRRDVFPYLNKLGG